MSCALPTASKTSPPLASLFVDEIIWLTSEILRETACSSSSSNAATVFKSVRAASRISTTVESSAKIMATLPAASAFSFIAFATACDTLLLSIDSLWLADIVFAVSKISPIC